MRHIWNGLAVLILLTSSAVAAPLDAGRWIMHLTPLPKSLTIKAAVTVPKGKVAVEAAVASDRVTKQAVEELAALVGETKGTPVFTIKLQIGGPESDALKKLKNSDQAYRIIPAPDNSRLTLVALAPSGLYYAGITLQQLVGARSSDTELTIPMAEITDWPDMEKRGLWGNDNWRHLRWLADRKMNMMEQICWCTVDDDGKPFARVSADREPLWTEGPKYGISFAPVVLHLEQVGPGKVFEKHPEFKGVGENTLEGAMCYSQPGVTDMIAEWIAQLASVPTVTEIDCWMAENMQGKEGCQCDKCKGQDRSVMEVRTILAAWEKAKAKLGRDIQLYILTSEATEHSNELVFKELPPGVRIWYYHSLFTYNTWHAPMLSWRSNYLAETAKSGRWLGVCPNLCSLVNFTGPFTCAEFVHTRMTEFLDSGLSGLLGYASPNVHYYYYNVEAAAEWAWNGKGRTPREFAYSWAIRQGLKDPDKFVEWTKTAGMVGWDVYGSAWPQGEQRDHPGRAAGRLRKGTLNDLGYILWDCYPTPWGDIKTVEQLDRDVAAAAKAIKLAQEMGIPMFMQESLVVDGYIRSLKALHELRGIVKPQGIAIQDRQKAFKNFNEYVIALRQVQSALVRWEQVIAQPGWVVHYTSKPIAFIDEIIAEMQKLASDMGVELPKS